MIPSGLIAADIVVVTLLYVSQISVASPKYPGFLGKFNLKLSEDGSVAILNDEGSKSKNVYKFFGSPYVANRGNPDGNFGDSRLYIRAYPFQKFSPYKRFIGKFAHKGLPKTAFTSSSKYTSGSFNQITPLSGAVAPEEANAPPEEDGVATTTPSPYTAPKPCCFSIGASCGLDLGAYGGVGGDIMLYGMSPYDTRFSCGTGLHLGTGVGLGGRVNVGLTIG